MGWVVLGVIVMLVVAFLWRFRKRKMASIGDGPISRDASTNYGVVRQSAESHKFDGGGYL